MKLLDLIRVLDVAGMPICEAFVQIEQQPNIYDVVHVKYFDEVIVTDILVSEDVYNVYILVMLTSFQCCFSRLYLDQCH